MNSSRTVRTLVLVVGFVAIGLGTYWGIKSWMSGKAPAPTVVTVPPIPEREHIPVPAVLFTDVTGPAGIHFQHVNGAVGQKLLPETMGSGVAVLDYDGDGKPDLLFVNSCPWPGAPAASNARLALYRNKGDGTFEDATEKAGLAVTMYGLGVAVGDYDNDGWPDVFVTGVGGCRLYHNSAQDGGRRFVDVTEQAAVGGERVWPAEIKEGDWYKWDKPVPFYTSATFLDYDGDGKLDLFVCSYITWSPAKDLSINAQLTGVGRAYVPPTQFEGAYCTLYHNVDGKRFTDVSQSAGVRVSDREGIDAGARERPVGKSLGVVVCDPDEDGWPDIVVANDTVRNFFFHNEPAPGGGRHYREMGLSANVAYAEGRPRGAMGVDSGEDRPGRQAVIITNFANEPVTFLCPSAAKGIHFSDHALSVGLTGPSRGPLKFGVFFFDYDLDGRQDLLMANGHLEPEIGRVQKGQTYPQSVQLFWNTGGGQRLFEPATPSESGSDLFKPVVGRGCAYLDYDGDGDLDAVVTENGGPARLLCNDNKLGHHWIRLHLVGDGAHSSRDAIGAVVTLEAGGSQQKRYVAGARGYLSQSEKVLTFGLNDQARVDRVTVRWPGKDAGPVQEWKGLTADKVYSLHQGKPEAQAAK